MSYNTANQISKIVEPTLTRNLTYDTVDRVKTVKNAANATLENYVYNAVGSRTSSHLSASYTYQSTNRLTASQTASYGYNANGNLTSKTISSTNWTYAWDYENRLTSASNGTTTVNYEYDALGRRTKRTQVATVTKFIYDGQDVLADDNAGTLTKYLNGLGIDNKLRQTVGSTVSYFLTDHLGSTNGLTNASGSLTASTSYDSFGNATNTSFPTRYQFTGREYDSFTGLYFYRARWYDSNLGRFISEDPIGFAGGDVNLFGYVRNNPVMNRDPKGTVIAPILILGGVGIAEAALHRYLYFKSFDAFPEDDQDRQRHCYVNCKSVRYHLGGNGAATAASFFKEGADAVKHSLGYGDHPTWEAFFNDSKEDMSANLYGQGGGYLFWKSCEEVCTSCPSRR